MPAAGVQLAATAAAADPFQNDQQPHVFTMSDGYKIAVARTSGPHSAYFLFNPGSSTWGAAVNLAADYLNQDAHDLVQVGNTLYLFASSGTTLTEVAMPWNSGTHVFGAFTTSTYNMSAVVVSTPAFAAASSMDVWWSSAQSRWYVTIVGNSATNNTQSVLVFTDGLGYQGKTNVATWYLPNVLVRIAASAQSSATAYVTASFGSGGAAVWLYPATLGAAGVTLGTGEEAVAARVAGHSIVFDGSGNLDLVYVDVTSTTTLATIKRTGTNIYGPVSALYTSSGLATTARPACVYNTGTGDLWVYFKSTANQANGEIFVVKRTSGAWGTAAVSIGGDTSGYGAPSTGSTFQSSNADIVYALGTTSSPAVYAVSLGTSSAPNTPTLTAPSGTIGTLTPTFAFVYTNPTPTDTQYAYEIIVTRVSDSVQMWDSGEVVSAAASGITYAGTGLAYGIQYSAKVRTWDVGLQAASSYSPGVTFTPQQAGTVTINTVVSNGVTYNATGATITGPDVTVNATWSQASSHAANQYQLLWYDSGGTVLIDSTGLLSLASLASGSNATLAKWTSTKLVNGTQYTLVVQLVDATTGVVAQSSWLLTMSFTPPGVPTGVSVTLTPDKGYVTVNWTNSAGAVTDQVWWRPTGGTAVLIHSGDLRTSAVILPPLMQSYDYGIACVNGIGLASTIVWVTGQTLGLKYDSYGVVLSDVVNPTTVTAAIANGDTWADMSQRDHIEDELAVTGLGRKKPISSFGPADSWYWAGPQKFFIPGTDSGSTGTITAAQVMTQLEAMAGVGSQRNMLCYRDFSGFLAFVVLLKLHEEAEAVTHRIVTFELREVDAGGMIAVVI